MIGGTMFASVKRTGGRSYQIQRTGSGEIGNKADTLQDFPGGSQRRASDRIRLFCCRLFARHRCPGLRLFTFSGFPGQPVHICFCGPVHRLFALRSQCIASAADRTDGHHKSEIHTDGLCPQSAHAGRNASAHQSPGGIVHH